MCCSVSLYVSFQPLIKQEVVAAGIYAPHITLRRLLSNTHDTGQPTRRPPADLGTWTPRPRPLSPRHAQAEQSGATRRFLEPTYTACRSPRPTHPSWHPPLPLTHITTTTKTLFQQHNDTSLRSLLLRLHHHHHHPIPTTHQHPALSRPLPYMTTITTNTFSHSTVKHPFHVPSLSQHHYPHLLDPYHHRHHTSLHRPPSYLVPRQPAAPIIKQTNTYLLP